MSDLVRPAYALTHRTVQRLLQEAVDAAEGMGLSVVVEIVDAGCNPLGLIRMDGSRLISLPIVRAKAVTAASIGRATGGLTLESAVRLGFASDGRYTNLKGGLPIRVDGFLVGGIGVGSATSDQDAAVGQAALDRVLGPPAEA